MPTKQHNLESKYIIWNPKSNMPPSALFNDRPAAIKAAVSMAHRFPGDEFAVCKIVGVATTKEVTFNSFE